MSDELGLPSSLGKHVKRIAIDGTCWIWTGVKSTRGYGRTFVGHKAFQAHRVIYEILIGPIPSGLTLDHLCRNRACVNPSHLEPVTDRENRMRGISPPALAARKTHCKYGHEFSPENTRPGWDGRRICRICSRAGALRKYYRDKARKAPSLTTTQGAAQCRNDGGDCGLGGYCVDCPNEVKP
jgi:hypothetical protein